MLKHKKKIYLSKRIFRIVGWNSLKQACGAGTQISGSDSRRLKFLAPDLAPTSNNVCLRLQNDWVNWKPLSYLYNCIITPA